MGILDSITGQILGGGSTQNALMNALVAMLGNKQSGGLAGLVQQFAGKGLGDIVNSWVSTGKNLPVTPEQISQALGDKTIGKLASQTGIPAEEVSSHLATLLPQVVDKLTPDGKIAQSDIMSKGMDLLKGLMK
jgi:uncharacterized protein YidB (DUF937 family)